MSALGELTVRKSKLPVIGWREWLALPELGVDAIKAKIDTGARSSALHASDVEVIHQGGEAFVRFSLHARHRDKDHVVAVRAPLVNYRRVKSSNGQVSLRPTVRTVVEWQGMRWPIDLTLVNRKRMRFRMLIGRCALRNRLVVDSGKSFIGGTKDVE